MRMHVHLRIRTHARVRMRFRTHARMHLPTYCSTIAFDILSYTPPHIGEGLIYMAKTKAKQPNKQAADASQPTGRQSLAEQPVGERRRTFWVGIACALAGAGLWGVSGACAQHLFSHYGITPMFATAVRSLVATLFFFGVLMLRRRYMLELIWKSEPRVKLFFLVFGAALFIDQFAYAMTIAFTNAGTATVLQMLSTVFVMLFTCVMGRHLPKGNEFAGLICAFVATVLIATQGDLGTLVLPAAGLFWGLLNAACVAVYVLTPRVGGLFDEHGHAGDVRVLGNRICHSACHGRGSSSGGCKHGCVRLAGAHRRPGVSGDVRVVRAVSARRGVRGLGHRQLVGRRRADQRQRVRLRVPGHGVFRLRLGGIGAHVGHADAGNVGREAKIT